MENNSWISVEEQLPDYNVDVLVRGLPYSSSPQMGGNKPETRISKRRDLGKQRGVEMMRRVQDKNDFVYMEEVTHWQPLPDDPI